MYSVKLSRKKKEQKKSFWPGSGFSNNHFRFKCFPCFASLLSQFSFRFFFSFAHSFLSSSCLGGPVRGLTGTSLSSPRREDSIKSVRDGKKELQHQLALQLLASMTQWYCRQKYIQYIWLFSIYLCFKLLKNNVHCTDWRLVQWSHVFHIKH